MESAFILPAVGALGGAALNKKDPLMGALMGGLGGYAAGPALQAGLGAATGGGAGALSAITPGAFSAEQAAMLAAQNEGLGLAGLHATSLAGGGQGLGMMGGGLLGMSPEKAMLRGGSMMMQGQQPQQAPIQTAPMPQAQAPVMARQGSLASLSQGMPMFNPRRTRLFG